jgi:hypothetical protein
MNRAMGLAFYSNRWGPASDKTQHAAAYPQTESLQFSVLCQRIGTRRGRHARSLAATRPLDA